MQVGGGEANAWHCQPLAGDLSLMTELITAENCLLNTYIWTQTKAAPNLNQRSPPDDMVVNAEAHSCPR